MKRYVLLVVLIYVTFSYAEETKETKEMTFSVPHPESQPNDVLANAPPQTRCPDGGYCTHRQRCCPREPPGPHRRYGCCDFGSGAVCCNDYQTCCPVFWTCDTPTKECVRPRVNSYSSVLRVPALPLGNDTDKGCRDGKAGMDLKVGRIRPSQQPETALKKIRFIGTSGEVFFPDEKYQCPEGTSICELSSGIYGCCHLVRGRRISKSILP